jgi:hypothetical protein
MTACLPGRPDASELAPHARAYANLVSGDDVMGFLRNQLDRTLSLLKTIDERQASEFVYAPGKWTIKQIIGHLSDTERIFSYRALRIARGDSTPLPGFEQDDYVLTAISNQRPLDDLISEFRVVRESTLALFHSLSVDDWTRSGQVSEWNLSVRGIAFTTAGHELHHANILRERYLPALKPTTVL